MIIKVDFTIQMNYEIQLYINALGYLIYYMSELAQSIYDTNES